jgi:restriction endonuclease S subunit
VVLGDFLAYVISNPPLKITLSRYAKGTNIIHLSNTDLRLLSFPLPPLEIQEQIVTELDGYAAIISGAKQIGENWKPRIKVESTWEIKKLGQVLSLEYGKPLKQEDRVDGPHPVFGSNGEVGFHNEFLVKGPFIIVGRKGSAGAVTWSDSSGYPIDTTFYVSLLNPKEMNLKFVYFILSGMNLDKVNTQSGVPGLNRNDAYELPFPVPALDVQNEIVNQFAEEEIMVSSAESLIQTYEARTQAVIAKLWSE